MSWQPSQFFWTRNSYLRNGSRIRDWTNARFRCNDIQRRYSLSTEDQRSSTKPRFQALPTVRLVPHTDHAFPSESEDHRAAPHA